MKIGVVDYQAGNLRSVETALDHLGADFIISDSPAALLRTDKLIFPGVGEAKASMEVLDTTGLGEAVTAFASTGKPLLGICIGAQILLKRSEERETKCLGIVPGMAKLFPMDRGLKVPHMGWNTVTPVLDHPLFKNIPKGASFYFVHSYYPVVEAEEYELCRTEYGITFSSGIVKGNVMAVQFHPEKSGEDGLNLLRNFIEL